MNPKVQKSSAVLMLCFFLSFSLGGCSTLKHEEYAEFGYKGEAVVNEGARIVPVDWIGNVFGAISKLVLWNWKVERHNTQETTKLAIERYVKDHQETLGNVAVQVNRYAPQDSWRRLFSNRGVKWPYRYTIGLLNVLILDTILAGRIFGGDRYDPFTHTVHLYSDLSSIALHELGHARDFGERRYRGSYALFRIVPFVDLYQEAKATGYVFDYVNEKKMHDVRIEAYKVLYPAYGTYLGGYLFRYGSIIGAIGGHIVGRFEAKAFENRLASGQAV